ncbi:hypothetical protein QFZ47_001209 [Variovorax paradoxus]|nr:hypothetical protein [Variovorax paradoxus]
MSRPEISSGLRLEAPHQLLVADGGAEIGEQAEVLAQAENGLLRAQRAVELVVLPVADGTEQHRVGFLGKLERGFGQRVAVGLVGRAADQCRFHLEREVERVEHANGFGHYFGADAVTRENCDFHDWI